MSTPQRRYYLRNRETVIKRSARWRKAHRARNRKQAEASRKRRDQERRKMLADMKNKPCMDCGHRFPPVCMDWDHVRGRKKFTITDRAGHFRWSTILKEVAKCDLVCANCHRLRTMVRAVKRKFRG